MTRRTTVGLAVAGLLALAPAARAQETAADPGHHGTMTQEEVKTWTAEINGKQYGVHPWAPSYEGTTGLFHMPIAYTLPKGKFSFSLFRDNLDRDPKDEDISIHGSRSATARPTSWRSTATSACRTASTPTRCSRPGFVNDYPFVSTPWETGVGDIKLGAKYKFLDDYKGDGVGLAVRGFVKLPTADEDQGPRHRQDGVRSRPRHLQVASAEKADIHGSLGYQVNGDPDDVDLGNAFKWARRPQHPRLLLGIQLQAELMGTKYSDDDLRADEPARPGGRPRRLVQAGLLHPSRALLEPQLRRPRPEPEQQELDRPPHLDRLPPRRRLQRDRHRRRRRRRRRRTATRRSPARSSARTCCPARARASAPPRPIPTATR